MGEKRKYIDINEIIRDYLPMSRKKARKFVLSYLNTKRIGNKIYVDREELEQILANPDIEKYPQAISGKSNSFSKVLTGSKSPQHYIKCCGRSGSCETEEKAEY